MKEIYWFHVLQRAWSQSNILHDKYLQWSNFQLPQYTNTRNQISKNRYTVCLQQNDLIKSMGFIWLSRGNNFNLIYRSVDVLWEQICNHVISNSKNGPFTNPAKGWSVHHSKIKIYERKRWMFPRCKRGPINRTTKQRNPGKCKKWQRSRRPWRNRRWEQGSVIEDAYRWRPNPFSPSLLKASLSP